MIILMKFLTVLSVFLFLWAVASVVFYLPMFFYRRFSKTVLFPSILTAIVILVGGVLWVKSYVIEGCSGMECMGVYLWPLVNGGIALGVFLVFWLYGVIIKRLSLSIKSVLLGALIVALILKVALHVIAPPKYSYDSKIVEATKEYNIENCRNIEYGIEMFMPRGQKSMYMNSCYHELALELNEADYCKKIDNKNSENCKNNLKIISALSKKSCDEAYDTSCVRALCSDSASRSLLYVTNCAIEMAKTEPWLCEFMGERRKNILHCK